MRQTKRCTEGYRHFFELTHRRQSWWMSWQRVSSWLRALIMLHSDWLLPSSRWITLITVYHVIRLKASSAERERRILLSPFVQLIAASFPLSLISVQARQRARRSPTSWSVFLWLLNGKDVSVRPRVLDFFSCLFPIGKSVQSEKCFFVFPNWASVWIARECADSITGLIGVRTWWNHQLLEVEEKNKS